MKECGTCTLCCLLTHIPQLNKRVYEYCEYCKENTGCGNYNKRPEACKEFSCIWLRENLPEALRPDKCHIMFEKLPGNSTYVGLVQPGYEKIWLTLQVQRFTQRMLKKGSAVIVNATGHRFIKIPKGIEETKVMKDLKSSYLNYIMEA